MHNLVRNYSRIIIHGFSKAKQGLLNSIDKFSNVSCCYEVVGGTNIQQLVADTALIMTCSYRNL